MPREYDYQDIEVRFGDLRVAAPGVSAAPGLLYEQQYMGEFVPGDAPRRAHNLARETERFAAEWWRQYAPVALQLDIYLRRDDVEFVVSGAEGESRTVTVPLREFERDLHRSVEWALSQLLRPHWRAVRDVQTDPEPAPEPPRPRKTFWDHILEEE